MLAEGGGAEMPDLLGSGWGCVGWTLLVQVAVLPCRASISSIHRPFFSYGRLAFLGRLDCKLVNWWVWLSHVYMLSIAEITCVSSFEPSNAREQKLGYV